MRLTDLAYPPAWRRGAEAAAKALMDADEVLICAHTRLDGDALSSMAAAGHFLAQRERRFLLYAPLGVPEALDFLPLPGPVYGTLKNLPFRPQTLLALDCGDPGRLGEELRDEAEDFVCLNIDHHPGPGMGTEVSLICPDASSTTQVLASVFHAAGVRLTKPMAEALCLGLITDTGGFRHSNATPAVFALTALLEEAGASVHALRERLEKVWSLARMRLWGRLMSEAQLLREGRVAFARLSQESLEACGALPEDTEGFVEQLRELRTAQVAVMLREQSPDLCRFSLRSTGDTDVRAAALRLGGGGHMNAAGGTLAMSLESAERAILRAIDPLLR